LYSWLVGVFFGSAIYVGSISTLFFYIRGNSVLLLFLNERTHFNLLIKSEGRGVPKY
jgi:hypothetical protein